MKKVRGKQYRIRFELATPQAIEVADQLRDKYNSMILPMLVQRALEHFVDSRKVNTFLESVGVPQLKISAKGSAPATLSHIVDVDDQGGEEGIAENDALDTTGAGTSASVESHPAAPVEGEPGQEGMFDFDGLFPS